MTAKKASQKFVQRYVGELASPIRPPQRRAQVGLIGAPADWRPGKEQYFAEGEHERVLREIARKAFLLFELFKIDPASKDAWLRLAIELAVRHVPGFDIEEQPRRGRPSKANPVTEVSLFLELGKIKDEEKKAGRRATDAAACKIMAKRIMTDGQATGTNKEGDKIRVNWLTKSLRNRYSASKKLMNTVP